MEVWQALLLMAVGGVAGFVNVMSGGGSLLTIPVMLFLGFPGPVANGTNRVAILAQNVMAVTAFFKKGFSDFRLSLSLAAAALPGAILGALIGTRLDGIWFERLIALIMIGVMILMARKQPPRPADTATAEEKPGPSRQRLIWGHVCMVGAGFWGGFIQVGVGFILMPILHRVMGLDLVRVNMHKVFIVLFYTLSALTIFAWRVDILWIQGAALAVGNALGGWIGAHVSVQRGERVIRIVFNAVLAVFVVKLLLF